jgi:hypothetical protein
VLTVGSHDDWDFEVDFLSKHPHCYIHALDCYASPSRVPVSIENQTTFHSICIGDSDEVLDGKTFVTYDSFVKSIGLSHRPAALLMQIDGW